MKVIYYYYNILKILRMSILDETKMAHHTTPQQEMISKLHNENIDLKEKLLYMEEKLYYMEEKCKVLNVRWMEAQERLIDYQKMLRAMKAVEAMEAWFNDEDEDDYTSHDGELEGKIMG